MLNYIYVGSHALNQFRDRPKATKDTDLIADIDTAQELFKSWGCIQIYPINNGKTLFGMTKNGAIYECELAWPGSTGEELLQFCNSGPFPSLGILYALKMSHRFKKNSPHFLKTMRDIREMRKMGMTEIPKYLTDWYKRREKETYDYSHPNLNQSKDGFFAGDGLTYVYDHDTIHEAVAITGEPMYRRYQKDGSEVLCDRKKWDLLSFSQKCCGVYEEACVLALERAIIPHPNVLSHKEAFLLALMKVCTSITSGWFREFAWENYEHIRAMYHDGFVTKFNRALTEGRIKPWSPASM